jgi:hypothetical protein
MQPSELAALAPPKGLLQTYVDLPLTYDLASLLPNLCTTNRQRRQPQKKQ